MTVSRSQLLMLLSVAIADYEKNKEINSAYAMKLIKVITLRARY